MADVQDYADAKTAVIEEILSSRSANRKSLGYRGPELREGVYTELGRLSLNCWPRSCVEGQHRRTECSNLRTESILRKQPSTEEPRRSTQSRNSAVSSVVEFPKPQPTLIQRREPRKSAPWRSRRQSFTALRLSLPKPRRLGQSFQRNLLNAERKTREKNHKIVYSSVVSAIRRAHRDYRI